MTIVEMHYDFKIKQDKVDSLRTRNFQPVEIDWLLNTAIDRFIKKQFGGTLTTTRKGFERNQVKIDNLKSLHVKSETYGGIEPEEVEEDFVYLAKFEELPEQYWFYTRATANISKDCCDTKKNVRIRLVEHDDLTFALNDEFNKPSYEWGEILGVISANDSNTNESGLYIYTDGTFEIEQINIDYIRRPARVSLGTVAYIDGSSAEQVNCDLPETTHKDIVDIAVELAQFLSVDPQVSQLQMQRNQINIE